MIKKYYNQYSDLTVLLVDSTKFNNSYFYETLPLSSIDFIVTDAKPENQFLTSAEKNKVEVIY
ncbi:hypothetical protein DOK78_002587 [Enterococcus sp. DIV2402]|uniref:DeoR C-terminal sensor domain-containing protein n=1 Tax=Candidatus Enterococcus lowellii TaxID=2230877 RepID=A0ABZ2SQX5_9ENTE